MISTVAPSPRPPRPVASRPQPRRIIPRGLYIFLRRLHLFTGALLVPWVLLYGLTAFLFNHPELASGRARASVAPSTLEGTLFDSTDGPQQLAAAVLAQLHEQSPNQPRLELDEDAAPAFTRSMILQAENETGSFTLSQDLAAGAGVIHSRAASRPNDADGFPRRLTLSAERDWAPRSAWEEAAGAVLLENCGEVLNPQLKRGPELRFGASDGQQRYRLRYDFGRERLQVRPAESEDSFSLRTFLLRLHTAHIYPESPSVRWFWALAVDVMAFAMISWAITGLIMWWRIRKARLSGGLFIAVGVASALALGAGMLSLIG